MMPEPQPARRTLTAALLLIGVVAASAVGPTLAAHAGSSTLVSTAPLAYPA